jgi:hypothetical protein
MSDGRLNPDVLSSLPDDDLMAELTAIPGIGPWTVQDALIIALGREDVVLPGDLALRKAIQAAYQLDHIPTQLEVLAIAEKWRPTGAWRPATCSPPPSSRLRHHQPRHACGASSASHIPERFALASHKSAQESIRQAT